MFAAAAFASFKVCASSSETTFVSSPLYSLMIRVRGIVAASFCPISGSGISRPGSATMKNASERSGKTTSNQVRNPVAFPVFASEKSFLIAVMTYNV